MPDAAFIESYPLYRRFKYELPTHVIDVPAPSVHLLCRNCGHTTTFRTAQLAGESTPYVQCYQWTSSKLTSGYIPTYGQPNRPLTANSIGRVYSLVYVCAACGEDYRHYFIHFDPAQKFVMKVGQDPAWAIEPDSLIAKMLGDKIELMRKGLTCESNGYGIAAYAYYRRIIEDVIDDLLSQIETVLSKDLQDQYREALYAVRNSHRASDKIEVVKDMLPESLKPGGENPLGFLYGVISEGLHSLGEEECLELATAVRSVLVSLVQQIELERTSQKTFHKSLQTLRRMKEKVMRPPDSSD